MRSIIISGHDIASWRGVEVWRSDGRRYNNVTRDWSWSNTAHIHYEVQELRTNPRGSWWIPASTNPPSSWPETIVIAGSNPPGDNPVNRLGGERRPAGTYIWIPRESMPFENKTNDVQCDRPTAYPPVLRPLGSDASQPAHEMLARLLDPEPAANSFQDADGLISFVNLASGFVTSNPEFKTGQNVCDKVSNFFSTLRIKVFSAMSAGKLQPLAGDPKPGSQWDPAVTHYMQYLLAQAGGLTNFKIVTETYSYTQYIAEFSTAFVKLLFDAATVPELVITDVTNFLQGVGDSLRASWDDRSRTYQTAILAQCHEAVQEDESGKDFRYFPKIKYYYINIASQQQEFSSPCSKFEKITFNFTYEYYVTGLASDVLDPTTALYAKFVTGFLDKAQAVNYKNASNSLDSILDGTASDTTPSSDTSTPHLGKVRIGDFGVNLKMYPRVEVGPAVNGRTDNLARLEDLLNAR